MSDLGTRLGCAVGSGLRALPTSWIGPGNDTVTNIDERSRRTRYERLEETIGAEGADTLMSMLPPVGWADVATTRDLDSLRVATTHDIDRLGAELRSEMALLRSELHDGLRDTTRTLFLGMVTCMLTMTGLFLTALTLTR